MKKLLISCYILITVGIIFAISNTPIFGSSNSKTVAAGEKTYTKNCLICHGETGKGEGAKAGTELNSQVFLNTTSDKDLYHYVKYGREGTAMPAYGPRLSEKELQNVVAYIRNWQTENTNYKAPKTISGDPDRGLKQYNVYCINCHGESGAGKIKMGTALANPQFLKYTTDKQLWIWTAYGREETRMGPSLKGQEGIRQLKAQEISDIVSYLRSLENKK